MRRHSGSAAQRPAVQRCRRHRSGKQSSGNQLSKRPDLARRAAASAATAGWALRHVSFACQKACADHTGMVPHWHDGRSVGLTHSWDHTRHNGPRSEPRPAYDHAAQNMHSAQRARRPHLHNGLLHNGVGTTRVHEAQFAASQRKEGVPTTPPDAQRLPLSCAAWIDRESGDVLPAFKMRAILGPQSGVSYSGLLGGSAHKRPW